MQSTLFCLFVASKPGILHLPNAKSCVTLTKVSFVLAKVSDVKIFVGFSSFITKVIYLCRVG
jgi:hypothetical protein